MQNEWYARNSSRHKKDIAARRRRRRAENQGRMKKFLSQYGCHACGETDAVVLEFHHVDGAKEYDISDMVSKGYAWNRILRELRKCQVLCANDHRRITAKQRDWYRARGSDVAPPMGRV